MRKRLVLRIGILGLVLMVLGGVAVPLYARQASRPGFPASALPAGGQPYFWAGVNYPWKSNQDFGNGAWGYSGVAQPTVNAEMEVDFASMAAAGVKIVKWRVFNDGRYSPQFDAKGNVTGLDPHFFADLDAAVALAKKYDVYLVLTLFASGYWTFSCQQKGVQLGGHAATLVDADKRRALIDKAIVPTLRHLGHNERVLAYEIIAEPEWGITSLHTEKDGRITVSLAAVRAFVQETTGAIHRYTSALATVEANRGFNMKQWRGLGLDYYSFSWYDWMAPWDPLDIPARAYGLDRPIVIGEFPIDGSKNYSVQQFLDIAFSRGYAGAFAWSYSAAGADDKWPDVKKDFSGWVAARWSRVNPSADGSAGPRPNDGPTSPPYAYGKVGLTAESGALTVELGMTVRKTGDYTVKFFLEPIEKGSQQLEAEQQVDFTEAGEEHLVQATFENPLSGRPYRLNVALFDGQWHLLKWFGDVAVLAVNNDGEVVKPNLPVVATESPCANASGPGSH